MAQHTNQPHAIPAMLEILRLGRSQGRSVVVFTALSFAASFVQLLGLLCFSTGFELAGDNGGGSVPVMVGWVVPLLEGLGLGERVWIAFFVGFILFTLSAVGLAHLTWIVRLRLLAAFEAELMFRGLSVITHLDPRDRVDMTRREMLLAVRSDCKSARVVFQLLLLIAMSLMTISLPLWYMFTLQPEMAGVGLAIALLGFLPVYLISKRAARRSLERQTVSLDAGSQVSGLLAALQEGDLTDNEIDRLISDVRAAVSKQHLLWREQYELRSLCQQIPIAFSLLATLVILLWGVLLTMRADLAWGELLTIVIASRVVFTPLAQIGNRWVKTAEHVPRAVRHLEFVRQHAEVPSAKQTWTDIRTGEDQPEIHEVHLADLALPGDDSQTHGLSLTLTRGSILSIVDPAISYRNTLVQWLSAEQYVNPGDVLFDGVDVNTVRYDALKHVAGYPPRQVKISGSVFDCFHASAPGSNRRDVEDFCRLILGDSYDDWMPQGIDSQISSEAKNTQEHPRGIYHLQELFDFARSGKSIFLVDYFSFGNPARRLITLRFCRLLREQLITVWIDSAPRVELGDQQIAVFNEGRFLGLGDLAWFERTHPDWDYDVAPAPARKAGGGVNEGTIEAIETEELVDEA